MQVTTISAALPLPNEALLFDVEALYRCLQTVADHRSRQGLRSPLPGIKMLGVLAKLAGQERSRAIAEWAKLRSCELRVLFALQQQTMPHYSTWSRVLAHGVDPVQLERILGDFFASSLSEASREQRGSIQLGLDGKPLHGTIPLGQSQGVHRLSAYVPEQGVVLAQVQVNGACDEPHQAPALLSSLDVRGVVGSSDALFEPVVTRPGPSSPPMDFRQAQTLEKGHGRWERRTITVSSLLSDYSTWPAGAQVFQLERQRTDALGRGEQELCYGITSLPASLADQERLLQLSRGHWGIEHGQH
jgi:hypothetical protein